MQNHEKYMNRALELALLGKGNVAPNPLVGCIIVHNNSIIGEGYHKQFGMAHAEPNALASVSDSSLLPQSTLYVNLEPCSHFGKTPPCANAIVASGIKKVVIANQDPFEKVSGRGIKLLQENGIEVIIGILEKKGKELNRRFFTFHRNKKPFVILKWAQTTDGFLDRIRSSNEKPLQISNIENAILVHQWRSEESAIMVGMNTLIMDNPSLTVRHVTGKNPCRVVLNSGKSELDYKSYNIFDGSTPTLVYNTNKNEISTNLEFVLLKNLDLKSVLKNLYSRNIQSLMVEGGASLLNKFMENNLWNEARITTGNMSIGNGVKAPQINGELKSEFSCGKECNVSVFSPNNTK